MKRHLLIMGMTFICLTQTAFSQINLNWASSFSPSWSNGDLSRTASNINGNSINCTATVTMNGAGFFTGVTGNIFGTPTPTVSGAVFTVPGAASRIHLTPNYSSNTSYTDIVFSFSAMTTNVSFRIADIDKNDPTSTTYYDRVTITGSDGITTYNPTITKYDATTDPDFLVITGNVAEVNSTSGMADNTASDATDQRGTINVSFGSNVINSITIRYDNAPGANSNTAAQAIAIGAVSFDQSTLPVSLSNFSGYRNNNDVLLNWTSSREMNSAAFDIERNTGSGWEKIGTVAAAGFSSGDKDYSYRDIRPVGSILLYRLRLTDIDQSFKYSTIVRISSDNKSGGIAIYPNPVRDQAAVSIYSAAQQDLSISIADQSGRIVQTQTRKVFTGNNTISLQFPVTLPKGVYQVIVREENGQITGSTKNS
ncbi:MAG: T9SS type A sorting domain-containing protein [Chitinophagaceae bacterium]|nr:T9SS type A sorting domain-containing protein [Chitinophagaceae bacterium]